MGETGAGKSTLLNKVLKAELAHYGFGDVCTLQISSYESPHVPGLRIYDTRGIEKGKYNIYKASEDIKEKISELINENNPDEYIHCIWYCIKAIQIDLQMKNLIMFKVFIMIYTKLKNYRSYSYLLKQVTLMHQNN